ncbi:hypothetical protein IscW_ISCW009951 [Ixodes scapularis]|uniref:Uncharacterized protein n=1 Tax=Ixodes scapularis TaxID=6945 RepID=B7Q2U0_IXOSC|nr:hypothetical protein IscW_ISCW009951 [Ixodes scapularis]|eukprot:XP_002411024.1 hypothetical protein IscW_ISCW009951 [Ixodes scapularis]
MKASPTGDSWSLLGVVVGRSVAVLGGRSLERRGLETGEANHAGAQPSKPPQRTAARAAPTTLSRGSGRRRGFRSSRHRPAHTRLLAGA